ncbi:MAG: hypothetical protein ABIH89_09020 [Elusimicrobiota bacterium]
MGKPSIEKFLKFSKAYNKKSAESGKKQFIMPYFIIGHPGADDSTEKELRDFLRKHRIKN